MTKSRLLLHEERYPYSHDKQEIITNSTRFENADIDFDPICLRKKYWEIIKLNLIEAVQKCGNIFANCRNAKNHEVDYLSSISILF